MEIQGTNLQVKINQKENNKKKSYLKIVHNHKNNNRENILILQVNQNVYQRIVFYSRIN
jgi:hypothetical protein